MDQEQGYFHTSTIPAQAFEEAWTVAEVDEANRKRAILNADIVAEGYRFSLKPVRLVLRNLVAGWENTKPSGQRNALRDAGRGSYPGPGRDGACWILISFGPRVEQVAP